MRLFLRQFMADLHRRFMSDLAGTHRSSVAINHISSWDCNDGTRTDGAIRVGRASGHDVQLNEWT